jgi:fumarylpyruvate hydrolase
LRSPAPTRRFGALHPGVGRNYLEHIREIPDEREPPFFFAKPADAIVPDGGTAPYPSLTKDMHHEVELVVALKRRPQHPDRQGTGCIFGYGVGIDYAARPADRLARHQAARIGKASTIRRRAAAQARRRDRASEQGSHVLR